MVVSQTVDVPPPGGVVRTAIEKVFCYPHLRQRRKRKQHGHRDNEVVKELAEGVRIDGSVTVSVMTVVGEMMSR